MASLLEPEPNEIFNKSGSVYVLSDDGESQSQILSILFTSSFFYSTSNLVDLIKFLFVEKRNNFKRTQIYVTRMTKNKQPSQKSSSHLALCFLKIFFSDVPFCPLRKNCRFITIWFYVYFFMIHNIILVAFSCLSSNRN
jgi:hypothetical protein